MNLTDTGASPSDEQRKFSGCAGDLQYWTLDKAKVEIDLLKQIAEEWDSEGTLYALIKEFHEKVTTVRGRANTDGAESVLEALRRADTAMASATGLFRRNSEGSPLTLAEKYEWRKMFRWLNVNLFPDVMVLALEAVGRNHRKWYLQHLRGIRQVVQRGYTKTEELPAPRIAEMFTLMIQPQDDDENEKGSEYDSDSLMSGPTATLQVSYLDPIVDHAKYMESPSVFMNSAKGKDGRYKEHIIHRQQFRIPLEGNVESILTSDELGIPSLAKDYRIPETAWRTMSKSLRGISKSPVDESFIAPLTILSEEFDELPHYHRDLLSVMPAERPAIIAKAKREHEEALIAEAIAKERKAVFEADNVRARIAKAAFASWRSLNARAGNAKAAIGSWRSSASTCLTDSSSFAGEFNEKAHGKCSTAYNGRTGLPSLFSSCVGRRK